MTRLGLAGSVALGLALVVAIACMVISIASADLSRDLADTASSLFVAASQTLWWAVGATILVRANVPRIGWLFILASVCGGIVLASSTVLDLRGFGPGVTSESMVDAWAALAISASYGPWFASLILGGMVLFPDGRLPSARWRLPVLIALGAIALSTAAQLLAPGELDPRLRENPLGIDALAGLPHEELALLDPFGIAALALTGMGCLIARYRSGSRLVRQQLKWPLAAVVPAVVAMPLAFLQPTDGGASPAAAVLIVAIAVLMPGAITVAVTRYRLYAIDRLISRTVSWSIVTAILGVTYAALVFALQAALVGLTQGQTLAVAASTLVAFALFQPIRRRVQRVVDRRFDRNRFDAEMTAAAFAGRLRDETDLTVVTAGLVATTRAAVRPSSASVWLRKAVP